MLLSVGAYLFGIWLKKKTGLSILNPLLVAIIAVILFLKVFHVSYEAYNKGGEYLSYFLTPATVCLAIPLYKQLELLLNNKLAVGASILTGVLGSAGSIFVMAKACLLYTSQCTKNRGHWGGFLTEREIKFT